VKILASAILLLWSLQLCAQSPGMDIQSLRLKVAHNPVDANARISLAYQLMLSGNSSEALNHYETLLKQDAGNVSAMKECCGLCKLRNAFAKASTKPGSF
jgi:thioredoxin-like negative regulator of GroEL